jgi:hypothetical protein
MTEPSKAHKGSVGVSMEQFNTAGFALLVCKQLYENTDGRPMEWRRTVGEYSVLTAVEYGVDHGWLLFNDRDCSICLTEEGRRRVRKTLS